MEDMIKRIIEIDKRAREITDNAKMLKQQAERSISQKKDEMKKEYFARAEEHLKDLEQQHRKNTEEAFAQSSSKISESLAKMKKIDSENHSRWVSEIVKMSIGS